MAASDLFPFALSLYSFVDDAPVFLIKEGPATNVAVSFTGTYDNHTMMVHGYERGGFLSAISTLEAFHKLDDLNCKVAFTDTALRKFIGQPVLHARADGLAWMASEAPVKGLVVKLLARVPPLPTGCKSSLLKVKGWAGKINACILPLSKKQLWLCKHVHFDHIELVIPETTTPAESSPYRGVKEPDDTPSSSLGDEEEDEPTKEVEMNPEILRPLAAPSSHQPNQRGRVALVEEPAEEVEMNSEILRSLVTVSSVSISEPAPILEKSAPYILPVGIEEIPSQLIAVGSSRVSAAPFPYEEYVVGGLKRYIIRYYPGLEDVIFSYLPFTREFMIYHYDGTQRQLERLTQFSESAGVNLRFAV